MSIRQNFIGILVTAFFMASLWELSDMGFHFDFFTKIVISGFVIVVSTVLSKVLGKG